MSVHNPSPPEPLSAGHALDPFECLTAGGFQHEIRPAWAGWYYPCRNDWQCPSECKVDRDTRASLTAPAILV